MFRYILTRFVGAIPQLIAVSFLVFMLIHFAPGEFCDRFLEGDKPAKGTYDQCRIDLGYDLPVVVRYLRWLGRAVLGDVGHSYEYHRPVSELLFERVVNTLMLAVTALVLTWSAALTLGVFSARWPYSWIDRIGGFVAYTGLSLPSIVLALFALMFAYTTQWFPIGDAVSPGYDKMGLWARVVDRAWHLALPASVIAFTSMAGYMRQMRASMIQTLNQDYIRTARAKGLHEGQVLFRHALINAVNPLITLFGYSLGYLLSGSFIVEMVMNWPGMARLTIGAILSQDEPLVLGAVFMANVLLIAGNLFADLLLAFADPRIRLEAGA